MHVAEFPCPSCAIPLRMKDRGFVGSTISCPDCGSSVRIIQSDDGHIEGVLADEPGREQLAPRPVTWNNPTTIGWIVSGFLVVGLGWYVWRGPSQLGVEPAGNTDPIANVAPDVAGPRPDSDLEPRPDSAAQQLAALLRTIHSGTVQAHLFPAGTVAHEHLPPAQRLSWIAALVAAGDPTGVQPAWDRPWNDPANARFVRRQQPMWLNPSIESVVSDDRYPATHFVGVAGVGEDAASLSVEHPRAGIFGHDRRVSLDDIGDGLANTMLVAGVEDRLGSWAAGGEATVRGFTTEPYVGGPDGFGTGAGEVMPVLMADGSVRTVSRETDPRVIRRMAAMNDGLPLDPKVPGEPGQPSQRPPEVAAMEEAPAALEPEPPAEVERPLDAAAVIADIARPQDLPIDVLLADPPVTYDTEAALSQKIGSFDQQDPVPVRDLMRLVEEMAAVPIRTNELPPESLRRLDEPVTLSLESTTVGQILAAVLRSVELTFDARPEGIFLIERADDP